MKYALGWRFTIIQTGLVVVPAGDGCFGDGPGGEWGLGLKGDDRITGARSGISSR